MNRRLRDAVTELDTYRASKAQAPPDLFSVIQAVTENAGEVWRLESLEAVRQVALRRRVLTVEHVAPLVPPTIDLRALGGVMLFALDRPQQIMRALRRCLGEPYRAELAARLAVWPGPIPGDVGRNPELLVDVAAAERADVVLIDSLKDTTSRIADDEFGSNVNRALQHLVSARIDVAALHHQRKGQDGRRPKTLEDVYGSTWITAGAGSVILLWGDAGSELVDLEHIKQPADPVGPWKLEHDHHAGTTTVTRGFDALAYLRHRPGGATLAEVAQAQWAGTPSEAQRKKTERVLRRLARHDPPLVHTTGQERTAEGGFTSARYYAADTESTVDTPVDTPPPEVPQT